MSRLYSLAAVEKESRRRRLRNRRREAWRENRIAQIVRESLVFTFLISVYSILLYELYVLFVA